MRVVNKSFVTGCCLVSLMSIATLSAAADDVRLAEAAKRHDLDTARALLKQQVNVNAPLPDGATALHWAAQWDDLDLASLLVLAMPT
jgi:ankyrin repeat protein